MSVRIRAARADDLAAILDVQPSWWDGRDLRDMLQPLFLEHFATTSLVASDDDGIAGFLVGFRSGDHDDEAYVHFLGVRPDLRGGGLGRDLHDRFAAAMAIEGRSTVRCVTGPTNERSVAFHTAIGFRVDGLRHGRVQLSRTTPVVPWPPRSDPRPDDEEWPSAVWPPSTGTVLRGRVVELTLSDPARDAADVFAALDDERVWVHVAGRPADPAQTAAALRARLDDPAWCPWTVRLRVPVGGLDAGEVVGTTSFLEVSPDDARGEIGATTYVPAVWGTRVNPECKLLLLAYAFEHCRFGRVQLKTDVRNVRSQQAIARLGATYEGMLRRYQRRSDGTVRDTVLFSVTAEQWPVVRAGLVERLRDA